jgi:hypothetical protein
MKDGKYAFDFRKIGDAHKSCLRSFLETIDRGAADVIVVDNTNTTPIEAQTYYAIAQVYGADVEFVIFRCPAEIGFLRGTHGVPLKSCYHFRDNIDNFKRDMPSFWKYGAKFTEINTPHTATDIANARIKAREACDKDPSILDTILAK